MSRQWLSTAMAQAVVRRHDPADTCRNALRAERRLGNAVLLAQDGYAHPTCAEPGRCVDWGEQWPSRKGQNMGSIIVQKSATWRIAPALAVAATALFGWLGQPNAEVTQYTLTGAAATFTQVPGAPVHIVTVLSTTTPKRTYKATSDYELPAD